MTQQSGNNTVLKIRDLSKSFGDVTAVNGLSLDVLQGEIFGFLGPNGAGKTTTINMICGLLKSDSGDIWINDLSLAQNFDACKHLIGLCPQNLVIWESLTCLEQLEFMAQLYDVDRKSSRKKALELLGVLGLEEKKNKLAGTLSGGMKRRLNIGLGLVHEPQILILDEPQAGLDPQSRVLVRDYVKSLARKITVILTTHDMEEADRMADRIAIIDYGRLLVLDTPENLKDRLGKGEILEIKITGGEEARLERLEQDLPPSLNRLSHQEGILIYTGLDIPDTIPTVLGTFQNHRITVDDFTVRKRTLEDVFITLTGRSLRE
jgi:ABC-2 type transport system ATP-binding protein